MRSRKAEEHPAASGTVILSGSNTPVQVTLAIQTNVGSQVAAAIKRSPILPTLAFLWPGSIIAFIGWRKRRGLKGIPLRLLPIGLLMLMTGAMAGLIACCAGGNSSSPTNTTPVGTSSATVTSTAPGSAGLSQSATLTLTITQKEG